MTLRTVAGALVLLIGTAGPLPAQYVQFATTETYLAATEPVREAYIAGIVDALLANQIAPDWLADCIVSRRLRELRSGFDLWLRANPTEQRFALPTTFVTAMERYCSRPVPW